MSAMGYREPNEVLWVGCRPAHKGTQIVARKHTANATEIVHTVGAGKTFYLTTLIYSVNTSVAGASYGVFIRNTLDVAWVYLDGNLISEVGLELNAISFKQPLEVPSGYDICTITDNVGCSISAFIDGWEEE